MTTSSSGQFIYTNANNDVVYELGVGIVKTHLRTYYRHVTKANTGTCLTSAVSSAIAFVHGSGLALVIEYFGLEADPEHFKETFLEWCEWQRKSKNHP